MFRPSWDEYFLNIAEAVSKRASCPRASSGVVLVDGKTKRILSTGYNGAPAGKATCLEVGCLVKDGSKHCLRTVHGEANAIIYGIKYDVDFSNTVLYEYFEAHSEDSRNNYYPETIETRALSEFPCLSCKDLMIFKGIEKVICKYGNGITVSYI